MKHLPLNLAQHPLLIKAFTGEDGKFTTEKCYAENHNPSPNGIECIPTKWLDSTPKTWVWIAPAADLEELLRLVRNLVYSKKPKDRAMTLRENDLLDLAQSIWENPENLDDLADHCVAVLEERQ